MPQMFSAKRLSVMRSPPLLIKVVVLSEANPNHKVKLVDICYSLEARVGPVTTSTHQFGKGQK